MRCASPGTAGVGRRADRERRVGVRERRRSRARPVRPSAASASARTLASVGAGRRRRRARGLVGDDGLVAAVLAARRRRGAARGRRREHGDDDADEITRRSPSPGAATSTPSAPPLAWVEPRERRDPDGHAVGELGPRPRAPPCTAASPITTPRRDDDRHAAPLARGPSRTAAMMPPSMSRSAAAAMVPPWSWMCGGGSPRRTSGRPSRSSSASPRPRPSCGPRASARAGTAPTPSCTSCARAERCEWIASTITDRATRSNATAATPSASATSTRVATMRRTRSEFFARAASEPNMVESVLRA